MNERWMKGLKTIMSSCRRFLKDVTFNLHEKVSTSPVFRKMYVVAASMIGLTIGICAFLLTYKRRRRTSRILSQELYVDLASNQWPIVYSSKYNISFLGLENCHPFDSKKWGRVFQMLQDHSMINPESTVEPIEISDAQLLMVHTERYINSLKWSYVVAQITEVPFVACICNCLVQQYVLRPFRYQTAGSILAAKLALDRGWAINIGGGFHHCSANSGGGFCVYADITLAIRYAFRDQGIQSAMIIDLDAHQGNGHENDFAGDDRIYILDIYNRGIYPKDISAKTAIRRKVELQFYTEDAEYLSIVRTQVEGALNELRPELVVYNAGTDILEGDPLGCLSITGEGIIRRDEIVFQLVRSRRIPIVMLTSGGYQRQTAQVIANSILNLQAKKLIGLDDMIDGGNSETS